MLLKKFKLINGNQANLPIFQGGMGYKVSTAALASAVANCGGVGVISAVGLTAEGLKEEIRKSRELIVNQTGLLAVNIMYALSDFYSLVKAALEEKIDFLIVGAGFSRDVFEMAAEAKTPIVPIVSSARLALISKKLGASAVIVESGEAGGHLGSDRNLNNILPEVVEAIKGEIPVIAAGGITSPEDMRRVLELGADGVQMGTRFVLSEECEIHENFKNLYLNAKAEDIVLVTSPVGLPGRVIKTPLIEKVLAGESPKITHCINCLKRCSRSFCLKDALVAAQQGDIENGLFFTGASVKNISEMLSVQEIFNRLTAGFQLE